MYSSNFAILYLFAFQWGHYGNPGSTATFGLKASVPLNVMHSLPDTENTEPFSFLPVGVYLRTTQSNPIVFNGDTDVVVVPLGADRYTVCLGMLGNIDQ